MRNVLMLTSVMKRGYGVSVVAREVADRMCPAGWKMYIGCLEVDEFYACDDVVVLRPSSQTIFEYCQANAIEVVVAQTSPYFEVLPALEMWIPTVVFEHGDPTPTMFEHDVADRAFLRVVRGTQHQDGARVGQGVDAGLHGLAVRGRDGHHAAAAGERARDAGIGFFDPIVRHVFDPSEQLCNRFNT
jgi:hypothetical protein